jgi:hypothetical protein
MARQKLTHSSHRGGFQFALQQTFGRFIRSFDAGPAECSPRLTKRDGPDCSGQPGPNVSTSVDRCVRHRDYWRGIGFRSNNRDYMGSRNGTFAASRHVGPRLPFSPMKTPPERGCSGGWGNCWRLNRSAAVKVVLVLLVGRPVLPAKFLKPSNEPRAGPFHSCSHGDLLNLHRGRTIPQGWRREVTSVTCRSFDRPSLNFLSPAACSAGSSRHRTSPAASVSGQFWTDSSYQCAPDFLPCEAL